jgi:iron complex outermembrane receptor protein
MEGYPMTRNTVARLARLRRAPSLLRFSTSTLALAIILAAPFAASPTGASAAEGDQQAQNQQAQNQSSTGGLPEIIITSRYRAENLQQTPIAITAITGEMLKEQSLTNVADLGMVIPNSNIRQQGNIWGPNAQIGLRGVNTNEFIYTTEPGVAVYIDDVYHGTLSGSAIDLLDLERVEVLRGPQGTLFGKNSLGGAIRLISKTPKGDDTAFVEATYGTSNRLDFRGGFDFAVTDNLFLRVTGAFKRIDGYQKMLDFTCQMVANGTPQLAGINDGLGADGSAGGGLDGQPDVVPVGSIADNQFALPSLIRSNQTTKGNCKIGELGGSDSHATRAMLRYVAKEGLEFNLSADYSFTTTQPQPTTVLTGRTPSPFSFDGPYNDAVIFPKFGIRFANDFPGPVNSLFVPTDPFTTYANYNDPVNGKRWPTDGTNQTWGVTAKVDWDITGMVHLTTIGAYRTYEQDWASDGDYTPFDLNTTLNLQHHQQRSLEVRLTGNLFDDKVEWTTGGFYYSSESDLGGYVTFGSLDWAYYAFGAPPGSIPNFNQNDHFTDKSRSAFAHVVWNITNKLSVNGGVRWTDESKTFKFDHTGFLTIPVPLHYGTTHVDWKADIDYKLTDDKMVYFTVSTGFRSDGAQPRPFVAAQLQPVEAEKIIAYEVGTKTDFFNHRLRANVSAFLNDYNPRVTTRFGEQCNLANDPTPGPLYPIFSTCPAGTPLAGQQGYLWINYFSAPGKAKGAELELTAEPIDNLSLNGSIGYYTYSSSVAPGADGYVDPSAREQPRLTYSAGAQYTFMMGGLGSLTPRLDMFYQGRRTNGNASFPQIPGDNDVPSYMLFNARLTYRSDDGKWSLSISAENLFDKFYWVQLTAATSNQTFAPMDTRNGVPGRGREVAFTLRRNL